MRKENLFVRYLFILTVLPLLFFSCKKNDVSSKEAGLDKNNHVYEYIQKLGYRDSEIKDLGDKYLVDGDIMFDKNSQPDFSIFGGPRAEQYGTANYVGIDYQTNISIGRGSLSSAYEADILAAINLWNSIPNCRVKFSFNNHPVGGMIKFFTASIGPGQCGGAYYPMNGEPGSLIFINLSEFANYTPEQRKRTIAHEIGHCIGLRHTNWQGLENQSGVNPDNGAYYDAMHILGTPTGGDPNSIMNEGECGFGATTLSSFDILATQFLYPASPTVPGTVPLYRYFTRATTSDHLLTTQFSEAGNGNNNSYIFEGIGMFVFATQVDQSIRVYRYYSSQFVDHYYTTNPLDIPAGYTLESNIFYVYPSAINGALPVYKYYNPTTGDHFYTKDQNEATFMPGYAYEGIAWYAH